MKLAPISNYDVAAHQAWLEDEAAKGNILCSHSGFYACFEKGEPKAVRYRMEPKMRKGEDFPDIDRKEVYASLGWDYVTSNANFHIWCCEDPAAPELNTDPQVQAEAYGYLCRQQKLANWVCSVILAIPLLLLLVFHLSTEDYGIRMAQDSTPIWDTAIVWGMLLFATMQLIWWQMSLRRFLRTLKAGVPAPQRRSYGVSRVMAAVALTMYLVFLVSRIVVLFEPNSRRFEPADSYDRPVPHVVLPDAEEVKAIYWKNWQTKEQWWTIQNLENGRLAEAHYYDFYFQSRAKRMARDLAELDDMTLLTGAEIDGAWWIRNEKKGYECLVVWDGTRVMEVTYSGTAELTDYLANYAALVAE